MEKTIVLSLGGSLIIPDKPNYPFLKKFHTTLKSHYKTHNFVVVCGGGTIARKYISALKKAGKSKRALSLAGIRATRENSRFLMQFFGKKESNDTLPYNMKQVKSNLKYNNVVLCGALRYRENSTSDETAAKLAVFLNTDFINLTNVKGLYSSNPKTNKNAKFIPKISWKDFETMALKIPHKAGQHFVLDQRSATIIKKHKVPTYIIGPNLKNLTSILKNKPFTGTIISE
jgi:uridylate kinase